jgi:membrane protease YdiL (CAAX protease family)
MSEPPSENELPQARPVDRAPPLEPAGQEGVLSEHDSGAPLIIRQRKGSILIDLLVASGVFFGFLLGSEVLIGAALNLGPNSPPAGAWVMVAQRGGLALITLVVLLALVHKNGQSLASIGLRGDRLARAVLWGLVAYAVVIGYALGLGAVFKVLWPEAIKAMEKAQEHNASRLPSMSIGVVLLFSLVVAVSEELYFRGFVLTRLKALLGPWTASVLISSVVFAVLHAPQGIVAVGVIFGLSVLLGVWFIWRSDLIVPIIAHMLFNTTSLVIMNESMR